MALKRALFTSVRRQLGRSLPRGRQFHPNEPAHSALLHRHAVKHIGFCNRAFVVRHDDELALLNKSVQHAGEAVDVAFIERRIHLVEDTERTRADHVDREQQRDCRHSALASAQQRDALQLFAGWLGADFNAAVEWIILIEQRQIRASAAEQLRKHFAEIYAHLSEGLCEQFLWSS